jgi:hypothetical protein
MLSLMNFILRQAQAQKLTQVIGEVAEPEAAAEVAVAPEAVELLKLYLMMVLAMV